MAVPDTSDDAVPAQPGPAPVPAFEAELPLRESLDAERIRWQLAVTAGEVGTFDWDLTTGRLDWDDQLLAMFGIEREDFGGTIEAFTAAVHPDDVERVTRSLRESIDTCSEYAAEYRMVRPDGTVRWVQARGKALAGEDGVAVRLLGAAYDTTARRKADARISRVLESMSAAFFLLDDEWRFAYVNTQAEQLLDRSRAELLHAVVWDLFPAAVGSPFEENYRRAVATGTPQIFEAYYPAPLDRWYEVRAWPGPDGLSVYFIDCTERRRSQDRLQLLAEVGDHLASTLDTEEAVARLARHLVPRLATWCLISVSDDHRHVRDITSWHADPARRATVERYAALRVTSLLPSSHLHRALRTGQVVEVSDATRAIAEVLDGPASDVLLELAPHTAYAIPLRARGRTVGAMSLFLDADRRPLTPDDLAMLVQIADRAGLTLDNARLYEGQRSMAESLQRALLSEPVAPDHLKVVVRYLPAAKAAKVGGDWYDAFLQPAGSSLVVVGDVIGHDTTAAAAMSQVRTLLRGIAYTSGAGPGVILRDLDTALQGLRVDTMATAVVARLEQTGQERDRGLTRVRWSCAGHPPPVVVTPDGDVSLLELPRNGALLGLGLDGERPEGEVVLESGSILLLYTDGLVERRGEHLRDGIERLRTVLASSIRSVAVRESRVDLDRVVDGVLARLVDGDTDDDVAVLAVQLRAQDPLA